MLRLRTKQSEAWRCRREQYLRESGRHADLIKEGYASPDSRTNWIVTVGGRAGASMERNPGMRLHLVKRQTRVRNMPEAKVYI